MEYQDQQPQGQAQQNFYAAENESSILRYQLDVDATLENIRLMLLGLRYDLKQKKFVKVTPMFSEEYCNEIMNIVKSFINKELILSGFSAMNIQDLIVFGMTSLSRYFLSISTREGGVNDREKICMIFSSILNYAYSNMRRALDYETLYHTGKADIKEFNNPNQPDYGNMPPQQQGGFRR
jgi:hypothetical protein